MLLLIAIVVGVVGSGSPEMVSAASVAPSTTYSTGTGFDSGPIGLTKLPNGKIFTYGLFNTYNGTSIRRLAVLNIDGSLDTTFNPGTSASGGVGYPVSSAVAQSDGKIIIAGRFTSYNGTAIATVARLNTNGSLDTSFNPGTGAAGPSSSDNGVGFVTIDGSGKILVTGSFTSFNGSTRGGIARLNSDGSVDSSFTTGTGLYAFSGTPSVLSAAVQSDGKIVIGGTFQGYNGNTNLRGIGRLNSDGSVDASFVTGVGFSTPIVQNVIIQSDGKIVLSTGSSNTYRSTTVGPVMRLNTDASIDTSFANNVSNGGNWMPNIAMQPDGKIIATGLFTSYGGTTAVQIARLGTDGTVDTTYDTGTGFNSSSGQVYALPTSNQSTMVVGTFTTYNGASAPGIVKLGDDQAISGTVYTDEGTTTMAAGRKVSVLINGVYNSGCSANTVAGGKYSVACAYISTLSGGEVITVFLDDDTENGITYTLASGPLMSGIDIYQNRVTTRSDGGTALTPANIVSGTPATDPGTQTDDLATLVNGSFQSTNDLLFTANGLYVPAGQTFDIRGATFNIPGVGSSYADGKINIAGTLKSDSDISLTGDWYLNPSTGSFQNSGTAAKVTMSSNADHTLTNAAAFPAHLRIVPDTAIKVLLGANLNLGSHDLTIDDGYLDLNGSNLSMAGGTLTNNQTVLGNGGVRLQGGETVSFSGGTAPNTYGGGIWEYYGDGTGATKTIKDFGTRDYYMLYVNDTHSSGRDTFQAASGLFTQAVTVKSGTLATGTQTFTAEQKLDVNGANAIVNSGSGVHTIRNLYQSAGTLNLTSGTTNVMTLLNQTGGTLNHSSGLVDFTNDSNSGTINMLSPLYDLQNDKLTSLTLGRALHVEHDLVSNSLFNSSTYTLTVDGTLTNSGGFIAPTSGVLTIGGDLVNNSGFNCGTAAATTTFAGTTSKIRGSMSAITFCNLSKPAASGAVLGIKQGVTVNISKSLTLNGTSGNIMSLRTVNSAGTILNDGSTATLSFAAGATASLGYLNIRDNTVTSVSTSVALPVNPANSLNSGNAAGWFGLTLANTTDGAEPSTPMTYTVTAGGVNNTGAAVTVSYAFAGGTATAGSDYTATGSTVTIPNGASSAVITVPVLDDMDAEPTETVLTKLVSTTPAAAYTVATTPVVSHIVDNDDNDGDGVGDTVENIAPSADGNGDGTPDRLQSDVTTNVNSVTGAYTTATVDSGCTITSFGVVAASSVSRQDGSFTYPLGMNSITAHCATPGQTMTLKLYYDKVYDLSSLAYRNFNPNTQTYSTVSDAQYGTAMVHGTTVSTVSFDLKDGGPLDDDGVANGTIVDPSGPAKAVVVAATSGTAGAASTAASTAKKAGSLANTGQVLVVPALAAAALAGTAVAVRFTVRRKKAGQA